MPITATIPPVRPAPRPRGAFTLIEMVVSLTVVSILVVAVGSVVALSAKAIPPARNAATLTADTETALARIASELELATKVTQANHKVLQFRVADRNNDAAEETIRYSWSGVDGEPLVRTYNGGPAENIIPAVYEFELDPATIADTVQNGTNSVESAETLLYSYESASTATTNVTVSQYLAQIFAPNIPPNATSWRVTRVRCKAGTANSGSNGKASFLLGTVSASGLPILIPLKSWTVNTDTLDPNTTTWQEFSTSGTPSQSPSASLCFAGGMSLLLGNDSGTRPLKIAARSSGVADARGRTALTPNAGISWNTMTDGSMQCQIYGTYTAPQPVYQDIARLVSLNIRVATPNLTTSRSIDVATPSRPVAEGL